MAETTRIRVNSTLPPRHLELVERSLTPHAYPPLRKGPSRNYSVPPTSVGMTVFAGGRGYLHVAQDDAARVQGSPYAGIGREPG